MNAPISYPNHIDVGREPPGFTLIKNSGSYVYHSYGDAEYYTYSGAKWHFLQKINKSEDLIKQILQTSQTPKNKCKMYVIHNTFTGKDMMLYKNKIAFRQKGSLTRSFISYMKWDLKMTDFDNSDFQKLIASGVIEVRELT